MRTAGPDVALKQYAETHFGDLRYVSLTQGLQAVVDFADYDLVAGAKWYAKRSGRTYYACRAQPGANRSPVLLMHRVLLSPARGLEVDHINGDGLDNRRANLRLVSHQHNTFNRCNWGSSGFRGVAFTAGRWRATIRHNGRPIHIGYFDSPGDAAHAYDAMAAEMFGEFFSRPNFPRSAS